MLGFEIIENWAASAPVIVTPLNVTLLDEPPPEPAVFLSSKALSWEVPTLITPKSVKSVEIGVISPFVIAVLFPEITKTPLCE